MKLLIFGLTIGLAAIALARPFENDDERLEEIPADEDLFVRKNLGARTVLKWLGKNAPTIVGVLQSVPWGTTNQNPSQQTYPQTYPAQGQYPQYGQGQWPQYPAPQHSPWIAPDPNIYLNQQEYPPQYQNQYPAQQYNQYQTAPQPRRLAPRRALSYHSRRLFPIEDDSYENDM